MEVLKSLLLVVLVIVIILCIYSVNNVNKKLTRIRRRYDYLLRGRGELNLEELIVQFGEELDGQIANQKKSDQLLQEVEKRLGVSEGNQEDLIRQRIEEVFHQLDTRVSSLDQGLSSSMKRLDERVFASLDSLQKEFHEKTDQQFQKLQTDLAESKDKLQRQIRKNEEETFLRFGEVDKEITSNQADVKQALKDLEARQQSKLNQEALALKDHLSLTLQKMFLYRYNAFEDLAGEQSFSLVMLDENNNGILLTSIFGRMGSSTYAKGIKDGKPQQSLSPEEETALRGALHQNV